MDLNWVKLNGFKRFEKATLNTSGKVIALVGANEAGKSSLLEALTFLNNDNPFNPYIHLTRNKTFNDEDIIIEAAFILNEEDIKAISHLNISKSFRWLYVKKIVSGERQIETEPPLSKRDITYIKKTIELFEDIISYLNSEVVSDSDEINAFIEECEDFVFQLNESIEKDINLSTSLKDDLENISDNVFSMEQLDEEGFIVEKIRNRVNCLLESINNLLEYEDNLLEYEDTIQETINILKDRIPRFLLFSEQERNLESNLELLTLDEQKPTKAIENFLKIANLDIEKLIEVLELPAQVRSKINQANKKIQELYEGKWSQSKVRPVIDINDSILRIFIENQKQEAFELDERSDGLRQFVALINFLEVEHAQQPILLVDEAELHLHYDAQADIIEIFTQQKFASKIIYTTHSVGCLPEDLGTGVKLVSSLENADVGEERSTIKNHFWSADRRPGVKPLLFGMGASQLAFMAIRQSVFVEGATDMLLLPTLFRQAAKVDHLVFQIVPGIAMTAKADFGLLENHASKVAFLVDNDNDGEKYRKQLQESGIEEARIFQLPKLDNTKVLEDYIRKDLYLEAAGVTI